MRLLPFSPVLGLLCLAALALTASRSSFWPFSQAPSGPAISAAASGRSIIALACAASGGSHGEFAARTRSLPPWEC